MTGDTIENKICLFSKVSRNVQDIVAQLEPVVKWRFLAESLSKNKANTETNSSSFLYYQSEVIIDPTIEETQAYQTFLAWIYLKSCLKHTYFFPDVILRTKLFCPNHPIAKPISKFNGVCPCLYGVDKLSIRRWLFEGYTRGDLVQAYQRTYFIEDEGEKMFSLKSEYKCIYEEKAAKVHGLKERVIYLENGWGLPNVIN